ncbi:MAG: metal-sensing transcriptional repressor [Clostridia bacterium]|nr:metal-sensing transcriptional repressor [Clostridia bacterium]
MKECCCTERTTERDAAEKKKLLDRLSRIEGQIRGIRTMLEKDAYCADVLTQSAAARSALDAFNRQVLSRHIHTCVMQDMAEGKADAPVELCDLILKLVK